MTAQLRKKGSKPEPEKDIMYLKDSFYYGLFPEDFIWSTCSSAYQIEGGWDAEGKGPSIWDTYSHEEGRIDNDETGDVACDSYKRYKKDIELLKQLGVTHYRFSISWSRLLPEGTTEKVNLPGIEYYEKLIEALKDADIEPIVALYHWDLPQQLQDNGGWANKDIIKHFTDYARVCFDNYGDRVKYWITFNEPSVFVSLGYGTGEHAPGIKDPLSGGYNAAHNVIRAHANVYHLYDEDFREDQEGKIGIAFNIEWNEPKDRKNDQDLMASEIQMQVKLGWFANPIFGDGDYPQHFKNMISLACIKSGSSNASLPTFSESDKQFNKGTADFMGVNYFTSRLVSKLPLDDLLQPLNLQKMEEEKFTGVKVETDSNWRRAESSWLYAVPWGIRALLQWIQKNYENPSILITENGVSDANGDVEDDFRIEFLKLHINNVLKAVLLDKVNVIGYTVYSLMDNFEWTRAYNERFGLFQVDFTHPKRKRVAKKSVEWYRKIIKNNGFPFL